MRFVKKVPLLLIIIVSPFSSIQAFGEPILSAYFGLNDEPLPLLRRFVIFFRCGTWSKLDGLPVVFRQEIKPSSIDAADFELMTLSGKRLQPNCATLRPAAEENENRTILLVGELGSKDDPPVLLTIRDDLETEEGINLKGNSFNKIAPLSAGPTVVLVESLSDDEMEFSSEPGGVNCPIGMTKQQLRVTWNGGITQAVSDGDIRFPHGGGDELGPKQYSQINVTLATDSGLITVNPFYIGDRNDGDNNIDLCLNQVGSFVSLRMNANTVTDPDNDFNDLIFYEASK